MLTSRYRSSSRQTIRISYRNANLTSRVSGKSRLAVAAALVVALIPRCQIELAGLPADTPPKEQFEQEDNARRTLAQIVGGLLAFFVIYVTWRRLEMAQDQQLAERFTRAITQLGDEKLEVRLGGIYALERIAQDSASDHWPIMETLTAYVRGRAPWPQLESSHDEPGQARAGVMVRVLGHLKTFRRRQARRSSNRPQEPAKAQRPLTDIQAALTVLGRRKREREAAGQELELRNTDLRGISIREASLRKVNLEGTALHRSDLTNCDLLEIDLREAHLTEADLTGVDLTGADLRAARCAPAGCPSARGQPAQSIAGGDLLMWCLPEPDDSGHGRSQRGGPE